MYGYETMTDTDTLQPTGFTHKDVINLPKGKYVVFYTAGHTGGPPPDSAPVYLVEEERPPRLPRMPDLPQYPDYIPDYPIFPKIPDEEPES